MRARETHPSPLTIFIAVASISLALTCRYRDFESPYTFPYVQQGERPIFKHIPTLAPIHEEITFYWPIDMMPNPHDPRRSYFQFEIQDQDYARPPRYVIISGQRRDHLMIDEFLYQRMHELPTKNIPPNILSLIGDAPDDGTHTIIIESLDNDQPCSARISLGNRKICAHIIDALIAGLLHKERFHEPRLPTLLVDTELVSEVSLHRFISF
ncbi:MAG: hypothetical protein A3C84_01775 [Candidatus Ryanbacteria bacterium RIFCSPHIGHO2_02_FULL_48_12]|nr:MAG: hypothetical protein A3C84_01775 [Candidatus Ryanbacteria bacterium RIFCSPHIGHO2_02_FULL_48_12]